MSGAVEAARVGETARLRMEAVERGHQGVGVLRLARRACGLRGAVAVFCQRAEAQA